MAVDMTTRWDNSGTTIPVGAAEYVVAEQPIAEYDNWFNHNIVADIQAVIDDVINKFNANTILKADTDNTPAALAVAEQTMVGRKTGGSITALTPVEVRTLIDVSSSGDTYPGAGEQAFLDADHTKLDGIETGSTKYPDTGEQAFLDADHTKLNGIETGATADQSNAEIRAAVEAAADSNIFTDNDHTKLNGIETGSTKYPDTGEQAFLDADHIKLDGIETGSTKYPDTGEQAFLDADHTKLNGIATGADNTPSASTTVSGKIELATSAEINTGTQTSRANTPDALAGSVFGTKTVVVKCILDTEVLETGNGKAYVTIPVELNGMNLISVGAHVYTASSSGTPTFQIHNLTDTVDMLSTRITIDVAEKDSATAATPPVINTSNDDVVTGNEIRLDCDVAGTGANGMEIRMGFRLP